MADDYKVRIDVDYTGDLHCRVTHSLSGQSFITDAPVDNQGKGDHISPTDLAAASIASCVATIMGIKAKNNNIDIEGLKISAEKTMVNKPFRRIGKLSLKIVFPRRLEEKEYQLLANVVKICPVTRSLSSDLELEYDFSFAE
jgi:putative redox protein